MCHFLCGRVTSCVDVSLPAWMCHFLCGCVCHFLCGRVTSWTVWTVSSADSLTSVFSGLSTASQIWDKDFAQGNKTLWTLSLETCCNGPITLMGHVEPCCSWRLKVNIFCSLNQNKVLFFSLWSGHCPTSWSISVCQHPDGLRRTLTDGSSSHSASAQHHQHLPVVQRLCRETHSPPPPASTASPTLLTLNRNRKQQNHKQVLTQNLKVKGNKESDVWHLFQFWYVLMSHVEY